MILEYVKPNLCLYTIHSYNYSTDYKVIDSYPITRNPPVNQQLLFPVSQLFPSISAHQDLSVTLSPDDPKY